MKGTQAFQHNVTHSVQRRPPLGPPALGFRPVIVGSLFLGATMGCREWVCTARVETSLWGVGEKSWGSVSGSAICRVNLVLGVDPAVHRRSGRELTSLGSAPGEEEGQREGGWRIFSERLPRARAASLFQSWVFNSQQARAGPGWSPQGLTGHLLFPYTVPAVFLIRRSPRDALCFV